MVATAAAAPPAKTKQPRKERATLFIAGFFDRELCRFFERPR
jgi:hypothetical protein